MGPPSDHWACSCRHFGLMALYYWTVFQQRILQKLQHNVLLCLKEQFVLLEIFFFCLILLSLPGIQFQQYAGMVGKETQIQKRQHASVSVRNLVSKKHSLPIWGGGFSELLMHLLLLLLFLNDLPPLAQFFLWLGFYYKTTDKRSQTTAQMHMEQKRAEILAIYFLLQFV